jgi:pilus assembly protein CpaE
MSEGGKEHTQVLLPSAQVTLFTRSKDTKETFLSLEEDWRFARVELETQEGDVETASNYFDEYESPDLVIVETEEIDDGFIDKLEVLGGNCTEGTSAIVIGPVNDVNLYRKLVGMGVSDYIVRPVKQSLLGNDIAATLLDKIGARDSRLIAFLGSKGGVGSSALSQALAWGISEDLGQKTFIMDTAAGWSSMSVGLNFEPSTTLAEATKAAANGEEDSLSRMLHKASERLTVLSTGGDVMLEDNVDPENMEALIDYVMATYPVLIIDISCTATAVKRTILSRANEIVLVSTPTLSSLRLARSLIQEVKELRGEDENEIDLVINMQGLSSKFEVPKSDIEAALERKPAAIVPFNPDIYLGAESEGRRLLDEKGGKEIVNLLLPLATKIIASDKDAHSESANDDSKKGGIGQFISKLTAK